MRRISVLLAVGVLAQALNGCSGSVLTGHRYSNAYVETFQAPATAVRGQKVDVVVHIAMPDPSWGYDSMTVEVDDATKLVTFIPKIRKGEYWYLPGFSGGLVSTVIVKDQVSTSFVANTAGTYRLQAPVYFQSPPPNVVVTITE